eukprot:1605607-Rhodomonas_salina.2
MGFLPLALPPADDGLLLPGAGEVDNSALPLLRGRGRASLGANWLAVLIVGDDKGHMLDLARCKMHSNQISIGESSSFENTTLPAHSRGEGVEMVESPVVTMVHVFEADYMVGLKLDQGITISSWFRVPRIPDQDQTAADMGSVEEGELVAPHAWLPHLGQMSCRHRSAEGRASQWSSSAGAAAMEANWQLPSPGMTDARSFSCCEADWPVVPTGQAARPHGHGAERGLCPACLPASLPQNCMPGSGSRRGSLCRAKRGERELCG